MKILRTKQFAGIAAMPSAALVGARKFPSGTVSKSPLTLAAAKRAANNPAFAKPALPKPNYDPMAKKQVAAGVNGALGQNALTMDKKAFNNLPKRVRNSVQVSGVKNGNPVIPTTGRNNSIGKIFSTNNE